jgi:Skp family chaperone for outer membrane proteins
VTHPRFLCAVLLGAAILPVRQGLAQNGPAWFMPGQPPAAGARGPSRPGPARAPFAAPAEPAMTPETTETTEAPPRPTQVQLPPAPTVPDLPRAQMPPAAVLGVLSIPDVLRASTAYQAADKVMADRRQKLNDDAQKEQVALRDLGQRLATDRAKLSAEQIRTRERELQDRITESRRRFTERNREIQEAGQYALAQIERTLSDVVQKVAAAHGMNLVLQRSEVALNVAEFDITSQVADLLNKTLSSVTVPPNGVPAVASNQGGFVAVPASAPARPPAPPAAKTSPAGGGQTGVRTR